MEELTFSPSDELLKEGLCPMLSNVALTYPMKSDRYTFGHRKSNPLVRYADDFVIIAKTKQAQEIKSGLELNRIGVELSDDKTHITEISDGFDFSLTLEYKNRDIEKFDYAIKEECKCYSQTPRNL